MNSVYCLTRVRTGMTWAIIALACLLASMSLASTARSDDIPQVEGEAPAGQEALKHTRAEAYFVDMYDRLSAAVQGDDASPGLNLISRSGTVRVLYEP